jgi:hypothetical protein
LESPEEFPEEFPVDACPVSEPEVDEQLASTTTAATSDNHRPRRTIVETSCLDTLSLLR